MKKYSFEEVECCEMCGDATEKHVVLGQRLNTSQGISPKNKTGIAVSVKKCSRCDLIYSQPLPIPFNIQDHYGIPPEKYWVDNYNYFEWNDSYFSEEIKMAKKILPFKEGMLALDIGAGIGKSMLSLENAGFDVYGFEPSIPFYERALSKMNIDPSKLKNGMIEDVVYAENTFDFISFGAVFEHLYHPNNCLQKALGWLKPNGILHIEVPSSGYLVNKLLNVYYKIRGTNYVTNISPMHSPFHLYEFGLKSFEALTTKLGFVVEQYQYHVCDIPFLPKLVHPGFRKYMELTNTGMQLTVYLRKNDQSADKI
jgi:2-polyprenyl-3-methyl-5-hydroxy-6-metoxy-1,4-benzoquinol methylase